MMLDQKKDAPPPLWRRLWAMASRACAAAVERTAFSATMSSSKRSKAQSSASTTASPLRSQMLWRTQQAPSTVGRSSSFTSVRFWRQPHRRLRRSNASRATPRTAATFSLSMCCAHVRFWWV
ncbi:hypothetical protein EE612_000716 [Oryza sativa]|nr:hypothetical protein EE612_000716 [Oryza sativa]